MTDGNTYAINKHLDDQEDYDALQEVTTELEQAEARIEELEAANDAAEKDHNISSEGNLWRFWSDKARDMAAKNVSLGKRLEELETKLAKAVRLMELSVELATWNTTLREDVIDFITEPKGQDDAVLHGD